MFMLTLNCCLNDSNLRQRQPPPPSTHLLHLERLPNMTTHYEGHLSLADIADLAGVSRPAVSNWRARNDDFPAPVEGSPERRPLFSFHEVLTWLAGQKLLPSNWKTNATAVLVSSAINPMAVGSGGSATVVLVALAVLAVYKNGGGEEWDELLEQEEDRSEERRVGKEGRTEGARGR